MIIVKSIVFGGMLYLMTRLLKDFTIAPGGLVSVTILLIVVDWVLGFVLGILSLPFKIITLGLLGFFINWIINVIIIYVTDKISDALEIRSTASLFISGGLLSLAHFVMKLIQ